MSLIATAALGFSLGVRHATDPDHVVAVAAIVSREKTLRSAAPMGAVWGLGHTVTVMLVGGAIVLWELTVPATLGLVLELCVALMLVALGGLNLRRPAEVPGSGRSRVQSLVAGVIHGLAGSGAIALLILTTIPQRVVGVAYLALFGVGTVVGMLLITTLLAMPIVYAAGRKARIHSGLRIAAALLSIGLGLFLIYKIGFVDGLFLAKG